MEVGHVQGGESRRYLRSFHTIKMPAFGEHVVANVGSPIGPDMPPVDQATSTADLSVPPSVERVHFSRGERVGIPTGVGNPTSETKCSRPKTYFHANRDGNRLSTYNCGTNKSFDWRASEMKRIDHARARGDGERGDERQREKREMAERHMREQRDLVERYEREDKRRVADRRMEDEDFQEREPDYMRVFRDGKK